MQTAQRRYSLVLISVVLIAGCRGGAAETAPALPGIDVLLADSAHLVQGVRVGILTNPSGVDVDGVDDITRLMEAGVRLTAIFSPEHGFRGLLDEENIGHGVDSATGLPVYSLYGAVRAPTPAMLDRVDLVLVDLQDIGTRTYTYVATAVGVLRATAAHGVRLVILDRPNPLGGRMAHGPVLDTAFASFNGILPTALRHGMTFGELVRRANSVLGIHGDLVVVPVHGWSRGMWFDDTGLPWIRPSPNMPDLESATHYPGLVLFEPTTMSVGRGTPIAFQLLGAPGLDAAGLAAALQPVRGVAVRDTLVTPVTPTDRKYGGETLPAVRVRVTDRDAYDPVALAVHVLVWLRRHHPDFRFTNPGRFDRFAGSTRLRADIEAGRSAAEIVASWRAELAAYEASRREWMLYR